MKEAQRQELHNHSLKGANFTAITRSQSKAGTHSFSASERTYPATPRSQNSSLQNSDKSAL
jgi:hypothetical protein